MKFCQPHWEKLKDKIKEVDLFKFVSGSGEKAVNQLVDELKGTKDPTTPHDPLMAAYWAICGNAINQGGLYLMSGDFCPLCELESHSPEDDKAIAANKWIGFAVRDQIAIFKEKGWLKEPQVQ